MESSAYNILQKTLISFNENDLISKICFNNNEFQLDPIIDFHCTSNTIKLEKIVNIPVINEYLENLSPTDTYLNGITGQNTSGSFYNYKVNFVKLFEKNKQEFTAFVETMIKNDPAHQGYIHSCRYGDYYKNLLFYNIGGNYRYCPKKNAHHKRN
ncbi:unnamed protein product [Rotaria sordida]|uniref:Uncharacterized protein n=1 Tax=Rotaria sordida TaxID=392033 RepID=A0A815D2E5_9BILA|nr:unnamed protein product [Rotaria sordida]CAF1292267.1 unnamed protein product [Rotaria sordida]CAF4032555.1 unnamed protein product [Rotaria sordida]CAF4092684.1 unnamed protein product [Rotaria sordida]